MMEVRDSASGRGPTVFWYKHSFHHILTIHSSVATGRGSSPSLLIACQLSGKTLPVVPCRESNSGLPYSKPTHYHLSYAAPSDRCAHKNGLTFWQAARKHDIPYPTFVLYASKPTHYSVMLSYVAPSNKNCLTFWHRRQGSMTSPTPPSCSTPTGSTTCSDHPSFTAFQVRQPWKSRPHI